MSSSRFLNLLQQREELIKRIKDQRERYKAEEFDNEDVIPGHDTTTPLLLENQEQLYFAQLRDTEKELLSMGWRPSQKKP